MVNARGATDELNARDKEILKSLRASGAPVSGEDLAKRFGISRVALWKRIEHLKSFSYHIESSSRGYRLLDDDVVAPWEFDDARLVFYQTETGSTMDDAWRLADSGAAAGTLVVADRQNAGRGRLGRQWESPSGGLYLTLVLKTILPVSHAGALVLEAASMVIEWLQKHCACTLGFQWPNDLMAGERKVGGFLLEIAGSPENPRFYTLGIGINVREVRLAERPNTGLANVMEHPPQRRVLATAVRQHLLNWCEKPVIDIQRWSANCTLLGKSVYVRDWQNNEFRGSAQGFDERGGLRIVLKNENLSQITERIFLAGEATFVRPEL